jgi:hypothetical protein
MRCNVCGRQIQNEEANFCEYCGSSFREQAQASFNMPPREQSIPYPNGPVMTAIPSQYKNPAAPAQKAAGDEKQVTFLNWLGTYGIMFIPIAGWLIFLVMLFVWAFGGNAPASKRNWARATLIFVGISVLLLLIYLVAFLPTYMNMYQDMANGTFDFNNYYNSLSK